MLKLINLKKLTAKTLVGILVTGSLLTQTGTKQAVASSCNNDNGHGNNLAASVTLSSGDIITVTKYDPSNPGGKKRQLKNLLKDGATSGYGMTIAYSNGAFDLSRSQANYVVDNIPDNEEGCTAEIIVSIEAPTIQSSQLPNPEEYYVVDFNDQSTGTAGFSRTNGETTYTYSSNLDVKTANQWGGADGSKFITQKSINSIRSYTIDIDQDQKYFGFWWSAGDQANKITFKKDGQDVAEFRTEDLVEFINSSGVDNTDDYYGNPAYNGSNTGHLNEPFSFVNVFFQQGAYDEIVVATLTEGGAAFESDNHTFSAVAQDPTGEILPNPENPAVAVNDTVTTTEDSPTTANILENDVAPNNDLTVTKIEINGTEYQIGSDITLASGALLTVSSNGTINYDPNNQFESLSTADSHSDQFTYTVTDAQGQTDTADVTLEIVGVADSPIAADDTATTDENTTTQINVLENDSDPDSSGNQLQVTQIKGVDVSTGSTVDLNGGASVTLNADGTLTYDPRDSDSLNLLNDGESEDELFSYTVSDESGNSDTGNVTVTVTGITDTYSD